MDIWQEPRLRGEQLEKRLVDFDSIQRRQSDAVQRGKLVENGLHQRSESGLPRQVLSPTGQIDPRQDHLLRALVQVALDFAKGLGDGERTAGPATLRYDAKGAGMVATVLHRDE